MTKTDDGRGTKEDGGRRTEGIANIEQGISNYEVEIAALGFASLAMTRLRISYAAAGGDEGRWTKEDGRQARDDGRGMRDEGRKRTEDGGRKE